MSDTCWFGCYIKPIADVSQSSWNLATREKSNIFCYRIEYLVLNNFNCVFILLIRARLTKCSRNIEQCKWFRVILNVNCSEIFPFNDTLNLSVLIGLFCHRPTSQFYTYNDWTDLIAFQHAGFTAAFFFSFSSFQSNPKHAIEAISRIEIMSLLIVMNIVVHNIVDSIYLFAKQFWYRKNENKILYWLMTDLALVILP